MSIGDKIVPERDPELKEPMTASKGSTTTALKVDGKAPKEVLSPMNATDSARAMPPAAPIPSRTDLLCGQYALKKLNYDELQPGDIVVTYESTSTVPSVIESVNFQKLLLSGKDDLHKALHYEIILEKHPRPGFYKIAHASGLSQAIVQDEENFKKYSHGQALMVFRSNSSVITKEIIETAKNTSDKGNKWNIKIQKTKSFFDKIRYFFKMELFAHKSVEKIENKTLRALARYTVDSAQTHLVDKIEYDKGFYKKDGISRQSMSCVQYAATVVNTAILRLAYSNILKSEEYSTREEKIETIYKELKASKLNDKNSIAPSYKFSSSLATSSEFTQFLLKNSRDWQGIGYIGSQCDRLEEDEKMHVARTSKKTLSEEFIKGFVEKDSALELDSVTSDLEVKMDSSKESVSIKKADTTKKTDTKDVQVNELLSIFKYQQFITDKGHLIYENLRDQEKIRASFILFYAKNHNVSPTQLQNYLADVESWTAFKNEYEQFFTNINNILKSKEEVDETSKEDLSTPAKSVFAQGALEEKPKKVSESDLPTKPKKPIRLEQLMALGMSETTALKILKSPKDANIATICLTEFKNSKKKDVSVPYLEQFFKDYNKFGPAKDLQKEFESQFEKLSSLDSSSEGIFGKKPLKIDELTLDDKKSINLVEKSLIKKMEYSTDQQNKLAINYLDNKQLEAQENFKKARKWSLIGIVSLIVPPVGLGFLAASLYFHMKASRLEKSSTEWKARVRWVNQSQAPNTSLGVKKQVEIGNRIWIHYTLDGKHWDQEPCQLEANSVDLWKVKLKLDPTGNFQYKFFIGPDNEKSLNPIAEAKAWQDTEKNCRIEKATGDNLGFQNVPILQDINWK